MSQKHEPIKLAYKKCEPSDGAGSHLAPVIFLHGLTASKEMWMDLPRITADTVKRTVYAVDARNHGDSAWNDFFNFDINVDDLLHTMDSLSVPKAVLVGHSMGGVTALRTALKAPERVERLIVEDMFAKRFGQDILTMVLTHVNLFREAVRNIPSDTPEDQVLEEVMNFVVAKVPESSRGLIKRENIEKITIPFKRDSSGKYLFKSNIDVIQEAMKNADTLMTEPEGCYDGPAYFLYGTISPLKVNEDEATIKRLFPKAELTAVEGAEHSIHNQFPEQFMDFLAKHIPQ